MTDNLDPTREYYSPTGKTGWESDITLSFAAIGLLAYLLTVPAADFEDIDARGMEHWRLMATFGELLDAGYVVKREVAE